MYTIERLPSLAEQGRSVLRRLGYINIAVFLDDGLLGPPTKFTTLSPHTVIL